MLVWVVVCIFCVKILREVKILIEKILNIEGRVCELKIVVI